MTEEELSEFGNTVRARMRGTEPVDAIVADILAHTDEFRPADHATWIDEIFMGYPDEDPSLAERCDVASDMLCADEEFLLANAISVRAWQRDKQDPTDPLYTAYTSDDAAALGDRVIDQLHGEMPESNIVSQVIAGLPSLQPRDVLVLCHRLAEGMPPMTGLTVGPAQKNYHRRLETMNVLLAGEQAFVDALRQANLLLETEQK